MSDFKEKIEEIFNKLDKYHKAPNSQYIELFSKELIKHNFSLEERGWLEKYVASLNPSIKKSMIQYNINSKDSFIQRLIAFININIATNPEIQNDTTELARELLKMLHAIASKKLKNDFPNLFENMDLYTSQDAQNLLQAWRNFIENEEHLKLQKKISSVVAKLIQPCINEGDDRIKHLTQDLNQNPQSVADMSILEELEKIIETKNEDCKIFKQSGQQINKNTNEVLLEIENTIKNNNTHIQDILQIKDSIIKEQDNIEEEKKILINATDVLKQKVIDINSILKAKEEKIKSLYEELNSLSLYVKKIEDQSKLDNLTEVYNRKYIDDIVEVCEKQFVLNSVNYSILFFDIDNFKNINDVYGHTAGDKLLGIFSKILKQNTRSSDIVGRYGGDEFLILMPNTDLDKAKEFAKRICLIIENTNFIYKNQKIKVTTSIGIADRNNYVDKGEMIDSADRLLYKAKNGGRNRVEWE